MTEATNVLGGPLQVCCTSPMTGFYRDGTCNTGTGDMGAHIVCAQVTEEFLVYSKAQGNDLSSPVPIIWISGSQAWRLLVFMCLSLAAGARGRSGSTCKFGC